jgi:hypothetical protein
MSRAKLARLMIPRLFSLWSESQVDISPYESLLYIFQHLCLELCQIQGSLTDISSKMNERCGVLSSKTETRKSRTSTKLTKDTETMNQQVLKKNKERQRAL